MKSIFPIFTIFILFLSLPHVSFAIIDPLATPNNRFGIHIVEPNDISDAARLINSNGGDWGYITLVIDQNDRNISKWQDIFDNLRRHHLIPLVRISTQLEGNYWQKPNPNDISSWADFLDRLNWVVKNRYIIIFNEPNHAKEWGNSINPSEYAQILSTFHDTLKAKSDDFFILPGGLDASAPTGKETMDETTFLKSMQEAVPDIFAKIDGWTSHSYPNPGFVGSPYSLGKGTIRTYLWEKNLLSTLGVDRPLPIFITETGWPHREGSNFQSAYLSSATVASYLATAFSSVWTQSDIVAITPFIFNYPSFPFDNFSWKKPDGSGFYEQYDLIQNLPKERGQPLQEIKIEFSQNPFPIKLISDSLYLLNVNIKNTGQAIFSPIDDFSFTQEAKGLTIEPANFLPIEPNKDGILSYQVKTPPNRGKFAISLYLKHKDTFLHTITGTIEVVDPPSLNFRLTTGLNTRYTGLVDIIIYDEDEKPIIEFPDTIVEDGRGVIPKIKDIIVGKEYRIVVLKPYFLPRQERITITKDTNHLTFRPLLPMDLDLDGQFTATDYFTIISHPIFTLSLLF
ncbi:hypothetical protein HY407_04945 [Candidatus Gottesmanbacteria bacterium]|nr:hypothetical protein [Candidatus Gottesmanbacteria bacterium]